MKSIKKISIGAIALMSILGALLITASPSSAVHPTTIPSGGDTLPSQKASPATTAHVIFGIQDMTTITGNNRPVISVDFETPNCAAPIGGTLHKPSQASNHVALGQTNVGGVPLQTHSNANPQSESGQGSDACLYTLTITANLVCTSIAVGSLKLDGTTGVVLGQQPANSSPGTTAITVKLQGDARATVTGDADFFHPVVTARYAAENSAQSVTAHSTLGALPGNATAVGALAEDKGTTANDVALFVNPATTGNTAAAAGITVTASRCSQPTSVSSGFRVTNAEPNGSLPLTLTFAPLSSCQPSGTTGKVEYPNSPGTVTNVVLDSRCNYNFAVGTGSAAPSVDARVKAMCGVEALVYLLDGAALSTTVIRAGQTNLPRLTINGSNQVMITGQSGQIVQVTLYISTSCPTVGQARFQYLTGSTDGSTIASQLQSTSITATLVPTSASPAGCGAQGPATLTRAGQVAEVGIVVQPRGAAFCSYEITYPRVASALSLTYEDGGAFGNSKGTPVVATVATTDGNFDAKVTRTGLQLSRGEVIVFGYSSRNLPIKVETVFPDTEFTTAETVSYIISVPGPCGRFAPIISQALGRLGQSRILQAFPNRTLVYSSELRGLEQTTNATGDALYQLPPVVFNSSNQQQACTVQVEETGTPAGCSVVPDAAGGVIKNITFAEGVSEYSFVFEHSCTGRPTNVGRGLTG